MKLLVTGGTTFVSRFTAEYFVNRGNEVYVLNRNSRPQPAGTVLINGDRTNIEGKLCGTHFDAVLDITAYTSDHVKGLLDSGVTFDDYILISSSAVYPETNKQPFSEGQPCGRNSVWGDYGVNKLAAEQLLLQNVPNAYILRPPYFYGIYENLYREAFVFDCAANNRPFYIPSDGSMTLQFFNVADLCGFIEIILEKHPEEHIFNVGNSNVISVRDWVEMCYRIAGRDAEFVSVDRSIPQRNYFCFYDYEYTLVVTKQSVLMPHTISLEEGLKKEYDWYVKNPDSVYYKKPYTDFIDKNLK